MIRRRLSIKTTHGLSCKIIGNMPRHLWWSVLTVAAALVLSAASSSARAQCEVAQLVGTGGAGSARISADVAVAGDLAAFGFLGAANVFRRGPDGRFGGSCPLPHHGGTVCHCDSAFYASPISGSWSCFCSDHLGQTSGTVRAFAPLGFSDDLTQTEINAEIGKAHLGPGKVMRRMGQPHEAS